MADAVSRTYRVRISLPNPPQGMELGMTASVEVAEPGSTEGVVLPMMAIYQNGNAPQVWVVRDHAACLQPVQVTVRNEREVIVRGVEPGSLVVVAGVHKLREGQKVRTEDDDT